MEFIDNLFEEMFGRMIAKYYKKLLNINNIEESFAESIKLEELSRGVFLLLIICYLISIFVFIFELIK